MMKRMLCCLLCLMLLGTAALADIETAETAEAPVQNEIVWNYDELTVGITTPLNGAFFTDMWGNMASDIDVRLLTHGYNLVEWQTAVGGFAIDQSVVGGIVVTQDEAGNHIYNLALYPNLRWSDGSQITAWDYAFSWILRAWPGIADLGGAPKDMGFIQGMANWQRGATNVITGLRVLNDTQLAITISSEYLPFFFELGLLDCAPAPISAIAPGTRLADDGNGVYVTGTPLSASMLRGTLLGPDGYCTKPTLTSGPYKLTEYADSVATFEINEYYKGNSTGVRPTIPRIVLRNVSNEDMVSLLTSGEVGLLSRVTDAQAVAAGTELVRGDEPEEAVEEAEAPAEGEEAEVYDSGFRMTNYTRTGLGYVSFNCEKPAVSSAAVRRAIALCTDKDAVVQDLVGSYGLRVDGYYGVGQWMVQLLNGTLPYPVQAPEEATPEAQKEYEDTLAAWEALTMDEIPVLSLDVNEAIRVLEADGWTENREGGAFRAGTDDVRCKTVNGQRVALDLTLGYPEGNAVAEALEQYLVPHLKEAGIALTLKAEDFNTLLAKYYRQQERGEDMYFLASNFDVLFDPAENFQPEGARNWTQVNDATLYSLAASMRQVEPGDTLSYCQRWLSFQQRFVEDMPVLPLYSNVYFDFYPRELQGYAVSEYVSWAQAMTGTTFADYVPEEVPAGEEFEEF